MLVKIVIDSYGDMVFYNENAECHRSDGGPAVEHADGGKFWYVNGNRHRTDGPAIEHADGTKSWFIHNKRYSEKEFNEIVGGLC